MENKQTKREFETTKEMYDFLKIRGSTEKERQSRPQATAINNRIQLEKNAEILQTRFKWHNSIWTSI